MAPSPAHHEYEPGDAPPFLVIDVRPRPPSSDLWAGVFLVIAGLGGVVLLLLGRL